MGFKDFLRKGSGLDLVTENENALKGSNTNFKAKKTITNSVNKDDDKVLKQLEFEVTRAIEKLEDIRDKLRVRRGY